MVIGLEHLSHEERLSVGIVPSREEKALGHFVAFQYVKRAYKKN